MTKNIMAGILRLAAASGLCIAGVVSADGYPPPPGPYRSGPVQVMPPLPAAGPSRSTTSAPSNSATLIIPTDANSRHYDAAKLFGGRSSGQSALAPAPTPRVPPTPQRDAAPPFDAASAGYARGTRPTVAGQPAWPTSRDAQPAVRPMPPGGAIQRHVPSVGETAGPRVIDRRAVPETPATDGAQGTVFRPPGL